MFKGKLIILFALIAICMQLVGQSPTYYLNPDKKLNQYNIEHWTTEEGLPTNSLLHIHQSKSGYVWISSYSGLIRFNGHEFKVFNNVNTPSLVSNVIRNISEDSKGVIWLTTQGNGLVALNDGEVKAYGEDHQLRNLYRGLLVDNKDRIWAASTEMGWFYLEDETIHTIEYSSSLKNIEVRAIAQSKSGAIWFATLGEGLFKYENGILESYKVEDGLIDNWVYSLFVDEMDNLWVGTSSGLCYYDGKNFYHPIPEITSTVNQIKKDRFGNFWIAASEGLYRYNSYKNKVEFINHRNGLPVNFIIDFIFDTEGNLWATHYKGGLSSIKDGKFTNYTNQGGLPGKVVNSIAQVNKESLWLGFDNGALASLNKGNIQPVKFKTDLKGERIRHIFVDTRGNKWISTYSGLLKVSAKGKEFWFDETTGFPGSKIRLTFEDSSGNIWVGTRNNGLIKITPSNQFVNYNVEHGLNSNLIMAIEEDLDGVIWVGSSEGVSGLNSISVDGIISTYTVDDGFNSSIVFNITIDDQGHKWLATTTGLWLLKDQSFSNITTVQGLKDNSLFDIIEDGYGYCWMPYAEGIMKVKKQDILDFLDKKTELFDCRVYNKYDGLPDSECNPTAQAFKGRDGNLYFSTLEGLAVIDPENVLINNFIPPIVIEEVSCDNQVLDDLDDITINPQVKRITFKYSALTYYYTEKVQYEYKLEGFEDEWTQTSENTVSYTNLNSGEYTFKVRACNNDGIWNTEGASLAFVIDTSFFNSALFYILILISFAGVVYLFYYWRISQLKRNQEYLEKTIAVRTHEITEKNKALLLHKEEIEKQNQVLQNQKTEIELHSKELKKHQDELNESIRSKDKIFSIISHDLRSPLGNVQNMLDLLIDKGDQFDKDKKARILENLAEITKSTFYLLDNLLNWSRSERGLIHFDPQMFLVQPVVNEVLLFVKPMAEKKRIRMISYIGDSDLAFGDVNMVKTIFRNFIENAVKFTHEEGTIKITSVVKNEEIEFHIKDSGVGLSEEAIYELLHKRDIQATFGTNREKGSGLGLLICKEFIRKNNGEFNIESTSGEGSTFIFSLKRFQL